MPSAGRRVERLARCLGTVLLLTALPATTAFAHKLKAFAFAEGAAIHGSVYFSGNVPAQDTRIEVFDPDGVLLAETTTDGTGHFTITAARRVDHRIVADSGDGHRAEYVVRANELADGSVGPPAAGASSAGLAMAAEASAAGAAAPPVGEFEAMIDRAIGRQIGPLREQLDAYEERVRWHDILGGLGYILGLTGLACYLIARRSR